MPAVTNITFPGLKSICRAEAILTRGVTPSATIVLAVPDDGVELGPGDLVFDCVGDQLTLPDCLPLTNSMRKVKLNGGWFWAMTLLDHRWRWLSGSISGEYNRRLADGSVDPETRKTPSELADLCLEELGEAGYDTSQMPGDVYPYVNWKNTNPGLALAQVCQAVACEVCGGEVAEVTIWPLGDGADLPSGGQPLHPPASMRRANQPTRLMLYGGPKVYSSKMKTAAVGPESDGTTKKIAELSFTPTGGWGSEVPGIFGGLSSSNQILAQTGVWLWYDIVGQSDGSLAVPGCSFSVSSIKQYVFLGTRLDQDTDLASIKRPLSPKITGTFWDYTDIPTNTAADTYYSGQFTFDTERGRVVFPMPMIGLNSSAQPQEPTLNIIVSYHVKDSDGNLDRIEATRQIGGEGGDFIIRRPELFDSNNVVSGQSKSDGSDEAERTLDLWEHAFDDDVLEDVLYAGLPDILPSGIVAQVTITGSNLGDEGWTTRASRLEEMNPEAPGEPERRRRELLRLVAEERGQ